jgi:hypothetical protein
VSKYYLYTLYVHANKYKIIKITKIGIQVSVREPGWRPAHTLKLGFTATTATKYHYMRQGNQHSVGTK